MIQIPEKFNSFLGAYGPVSFDSWCGEPVMWGYPIKQRLGEELWAELSQFGQLEYVGGHENGNWALIIKRLTRGDAIEQYGPQTSIDIGPRGGFRSITFGTKTFCQKWLRGD